ncbi:trypsin-1-like [Pectinophora gossypiella]|uniref:trypsin-1-like n=1 Tax=Pectinophora gossypiella TaxID=13191 RepID=UPI00214DFD8B|nr:trypsin-1-like [Pectinophora gossypiella]
MNFPEPAKVPIGYVNKERQLKQLRIQFDLIIIPVPINRGSLAKAPIWDQPHENRKNDLSRLDIEQYSEPTEVPDVDNFDYNLEKIDNNNKRTDTEERDEYDDGNYAGDKIVGGQEVDINLYPYHVAYGSNCGGAIIDKKWVLTAGHCGKKPYVRVGSKYLNQGKKVLVKSHTVHPLWFAKTKEHPFDFDFQVLELMENLKFDDNIQPIKVANIEDMVIGKVITVTGWGNTEENGPYSNVLRAVRVPIISKEHCQSVPFPYFRGSLTPRMFCAGFSEGKKDACQGDSGGPAVSNDRLLGMVSFGYGCATPGSYGVYSKVAKVRDWIKTVTGVNLQ